MSVDAVLGLTWFPVQTQIEHATKHVTQVPASSAVRAVPRGVLERLEGFEHTAVRARRRYDPIGTFVPRRIPPQRTSSCVSGRRNVTLYAAGATAGQVRGLDKWGRANKTHGPVMR